MTIIIGAGISGLTLAWNLQKLGKPYLLLESGLIPGGYIQTVQDGAYQIELGPNSLLADSETEQFLAELGLENEILQANPVSNSRYIYRNGAYRKLPSSPPALIAGSFFSFGAKFKILTEFFNLSKGSAGESLTDFFTRRFGKEVVDYALDPFVTGIYAGDINNLLVAETFPALLKMEQQFGSVLKGFIKTAGASRRKSMNFKAGMQTLPNALAANLTGIKWGHKSLKIEKTDAGFLVKGITDETPFAFKADKVVLSLPAFALNDLISEAFPDLSKAASQIVYPPMVAIHTVFKRKEVAHSLNGFGGLNPGIEKRFCAGSIWTSSVFSGRCPEDEVLLTTFVGGVKNASNTLLPDDEILKRVIEELRETYFITGKAVYTRLTRWPKAIPQYDKYLAATNIAAQKAEAAGLFICANWHGGISLQDCMKKAKVLAEEI